MIDLRSDTVTGPTDEMRRAMAAAEVGDDVYGEDPTVNRLEELGAGLLGKEGALFAATGTQANLLALLTHCARGEEYLAGEDYHIYRFEGGGGAVLGGIQPQPLAVEEDGTVDLRRLEGAIKPDDAHFSRSRLLCVENTHNGKALPPAYLQGACSLAGRRRLATHLDGARIWNAAAEQGISPGELAAGFDTVSACLSKGMGAPAGTLLCGSSEFVREARRWRKVVGGGMRQSGILAAAALVALQEGWKRLAEDHRKAAALAAGLREIPALEPFVEGSFTNMVFLRLPAPAVAPFRFFMHRRNILVGGREAVRLVTHRDLEDGAVPAFLNAAAAFARAELPPLLEELRRGSSPAAS